jgi:hypothetical protein
MRRMFQHLGVKPDREVLTSCGGGGAVLALPVLDSLGQQRLSMQFDSIERWADAGHDIARPAAVTTPAGGATGAILVMPGQAPGSVRVMIANLDAETCAVAADAGVEIERIA